MIYLNDNYEGGSTNFYKEPMDSKLNGKKGSINREKDLIASVSPKTGKALIFTHESFHEGAEILKGSKYIIRTESRIFKKKNLFLS